MKKILTTIRLFLYSILAIPHLLIYFTHRKRSIVCIDAKRWLELYGIPYRNTMGFIYLLSYYPEFRNLFYLRIGAIHNLLKIILPKMSTLCLLTPNIGEGCFIQHGIGTIIGAKSIGKNCWINQGVSIGFTNKSDTPTLGDNVRVSAGAKIFGGIEIGDNSVIGANAVVLKNVPPNCVVVGIPAYIVKRNGVKVKEEL